MSGVQVVRKSLRLIETSVCPDIARLVQPGPFGDSENYLTVAFGDAGSDHPLPKLTALKYWIFVYSKGRLFGSILAKRQSTLFLPLSSETVN